MHRPLSWYFRRHPLLYKIRFRLVSKDATIDRIENFSYNDINMMCDVPSIYYEMNSLIFAKIDTELTDIEKAKTIAIWLRDNIKGGSGLSKSSEVVLTKMLNGEGGVCSDITQVFNNFCVINSLKVKEWGLKIVNEDETINGGHSFNEVYSTEFQKWILIDVSKSILFYNSNPNIPLSVFELITVKKENKEVSFISFNKNNNIDHKNTNNTYLISKSYPFLITNYYNKTYDYMLENLDFLPIFMIHGLLILAGKSYAYEFPPANKN